MQLVVFHQEGSVIDGDYAIPVDAPRDRAKILPGEVYVTCDNFYRLNRNLMETVAAPDLKLPRLLGRESLDELKAFPADVVRILIVNGFGSGYGDLLAGSVALERLHHCIRAQGKQPVIDLLIREGRWPRYCEVFKLNPYLRRIVSLVMPLSELAGYDFMVSTEHLLFDPEFRTRNLIDFFLARLGLDPATEKRWLTLYPDPRIMSRMARLARSLREERPGERFVVLNFFASAVRRVPPFLWRSLVEAFCDRYVVALVGTDRHRGTIAGFVQGLPASLRGRVIDLVGVSSRSFDCLIGLVRHLADGVVTPDTSVLHVCGGLGSPCVGIFATIEPELRIRDYPTVRAYCPDFFRASRFWGESRLMPEQNASLDEDPEYRGLWRRVDVHAIRSLLDRARADAPARAGLPQSVHVNTGRAPRALVWAGTEPTRLADRFHYHLVASVLPPGCELEWVPVRPFAFRSLAAYDLVLLGGGEVLEPATLEQPRLLDLLHAARRRVGLFGLGAGSGVSASRAAEAMECLDLWFARTRGDLERYGREHGNAHHLGEWLITLIPSSSWRTSDELAVDERHYSGPLDDLVKQVQLFRRVKAAGPIALVSALLSAERVWWEEEAGGRETAPLGTLLEDILGSVPAQRCWHRVPRAQVAAYKERVQRNLVALREGLAALLDS